MDISIVVPVFNEEKNIPILYQQIKSAMISLVKDYEIIFVDDGSVDRTPTVLDNLALTDSCMCVVHFDKNYGVAAALACAFSLAKGEFIFTIDADLQCKVSDIVHIIEGLRDYDVVISKRINRYEADGFIKIVSSRIGNFIRNIILSENFADAGSSLRGFKRECLKDLALYRNFEVFLPSLMKIRGYKIKEIAIETFSRQYGKSNFGIKNRLVDYFFALLVLRWQKMNELSYKIKYSIKNKESGI